MIRSWLPPPVGYAVTALAIYLLLILAQSTSVRWLDPLVPGPVRLFTECACLFPEAQQVSTDFRLEAWSCERGRFEEIDYRPYFPMRPDDKENRFQRLGHFYRRNPKVMGQLEDFLRGRHNAAAATEDGVEGKIGGIRLLSVRTPQPPPGGAIERFHRRPLVEIPEDNKHIFYQTTEKQRAARCAGVQP
jgi:hypothetical protein